MYRSMSEFSSKPTTSRAVLKDRAKGALEGRYGVAVWVFFLMEAVAWMANSVISSGTSLVGILAPYETVLDIANYLLIVLASLFTGVLKTGICLFCLNLCCGHRAQVSDLFYGYHYQFGKSMLLSLVNVLLAQFYLLPANLLIDAWASGENDSLFYCYAGLTAAGFVVYAWLSLYPAMSWYLLLDFPDCSAPELLRLGARVIRGHKRRLFVLYLSFLPLELLNLCTFGIGGLWIRPYIRTTYTEFFLDLMKKD